jgi:guanylate kinase
MTGAILVLSGPSGAGKSTIIKESSDNIGSYYFSISTTTRKPRDGEVDGVDYHFVSRNSFEEDIKAGNFLEYATVHNNYYGTSLVPVAKALEDGKLVIFDIDVQGHRLIRAKLGDITTSAFITPPSIDELDYRLNIRRTDNKDIISQRMDNAKKEIEAIHEYDYVIINDDIKTASQEFTLIANVSILKQSRAELNDFIIHWLKTTKN